MYIHTIELLTHVNMISQADILGSTIVDRHCKNANSQAIHGWTVGACGVTPLITSLITPRPNQSALILASVLIQEGSIARSSGITTLAAPTSSPNPYESREPCVYNITYNSPLHTIELGACSCSIIYCYATDTIDRNYMCSCIPIADTIRASLPFMFEKAIPIKRKLSIKF